MQKILLLAFFILYCITLQAQRQTVYLEGLGSGLFGSVNYEWQLTAAPQFAVRAGVGYYHENESRLSIPVSFHYLKKLKGEKITDFLDFGIGMTWVDSSDGLIGDEDGTTDNALYNLIAQFGYREHFGNNWMWRASLTPIVINNKGVTLPWFGLSLGKRF